MLLDKTLLINCCVDAMYAGLDHISEHRCRNTCLLGGGALPPKAEKNAQAVHLGGSWGMPPPPPQENFLIWCSETPSESISSLKRAVLLVFIQQT